MLRIWICLAAGLLTTLTAVAAEQGPLTSQFYVALGAYAFDADTKLRIDGAGGERGTEIDWEEDLGLNNRNSFRVDAFWRFAERHKIRAMYFQNTRSNSTPLERDLTIAGEDFPTDAVVRASIQTKILEVAYEYAFLKRDNYEVSATAGIHLTGLEPGLEITGSVGNANVDIGQSADADLNAPLPVFGLRGMWRIGGDFYLDVHAQYFYLAYGDSDGSLTDYRAAFTWNPRSWFGLGVGYNGFVSDLDVDEDDFEGKIDWKYRGPQVFLIATF